MAKSARTIQAEVEAPRGGVFYLSGADEYRKEEAARALAAAHLDPATRDFNFDVVRGSQADFESLAVLLGTPPMMAEWRVILVRETQAFATSAKIREFLLATAKAPPDGLALILLCTMPEKSTAKFYQEMAKAARSFDFALPDPNDLPFWAMETARDSFGREMTEEAARALVQGIGAETGLLTREIEKLATLVGEGAPITLQTVEAAGTRIPRQDRWRWFEMIGERKFLEAIEGLPILLDHGETGVGLVIGTTTHLLRVGVVADGGSRALEALLPPNQKWLARKYLDQARLWTPSEIEAALAGLMRVDELLKSSRMTAEHLIEGWLLERIATGAAAGAPPLPDALPPAAAPLPSPAPAPSPPSPSAPAPAPSPPFSPSASPAAPVEERSQDFPSGAFTLQLGAFSTDLRAGVLAADASAAGVEVRIVKVEGSDLFRVRHGAFETREAADVRARSLRDLGFETVISSDREREIGG